MATTALAVQSLPAFHRASWWKKLNTREQNTVRSETEELAKSLLKFGVSKLEIGEHLTKIRKILEPHRLFMKYLKFFRIKTKTAYRYINGYENAKEHLAPQIVEAAMARNINIIGDTPDQPLGIYTKAIKKNPPPRRLTAERIDEWFTQIEEASKQKRGSRAAVQQTPKKALKECFRFVNLRYRRLQDNPKLRSSWVKELVGLLINLLGVKEKAVMFHPVDIPKGYVTAPGRPKEAAA